MSRYKEAVKNLIKSLPYGDPVILPLARYMVGIVNSRYRHPLRAKKITEKREADYILKRLKSNDFDEAVIVYELKVSPPTYGDFFYVVMIARFFLIMGKKVKFFIINSEFRKDTLDAYADEECNELVVRLSELPEIILKGKNCDTQITNWHVFTKMMDKFEKAKTSLIVFKDKIMKRESIYNHSFNLINRLVSSLDSNQVNKFLLSKDDFASSVDIKYPQTPYITWAARYSTKWSFDRNTTEDEFIRIYTSLHSLYPNHTIMIVSDEIGCNYFKKLAQKNNLPSLFSKDFSGTFMGDCALMMGSDYYFQLRGGGIACAAIFSSLPHYIIAVPVHEAVWKKNGLAVWAHDKQIYKEGTEGLPTDAAANK